MTQEDKNILLKDLSARLPYRVKFQGEDSNVYTLDASNYFTLQVEDVVFKPYLRPMSSMTEEEEEEYDTFFNTDYSYMDASKVFNVSDWMYAHHFDYRGLIEKGLAIEAPEGMYKAE